eukprot:366247-Chlamydomonas_euryale.AAC.11
MQVSTTAHSCLLDRRLRVPAQVTACGYVAEGCSTHCSCTAQSLKGCYKYHSGELQATSGQETPNQICADGGQELETV